MALFRDQLLKYSFFRCRSYHLPWCDEDVVVETDNKGAYDLCHRYTSAANSRHVDRKLFKMRELRGAGVVRVRHIAGETNPADLFTKILTRQPFEKHRKFVLNLPGNSGVEQARAEAAAVGAHRRVREARVEHGLVQEAAQQHADFTG